MQSGMSALVSLGCLLVFALLQTKKYRDDDMWLKPAEG